MTSVATIPLTSIKHYRTDEEIAKSARDEIIEFADNDPQKVYEIVLRAIWSSKHQE